MAVPKNLDKAIIWFKSLDCLKLYKYKNLAEKIRYKLVYELRNLDEIKYYELARGNSAWSAMLKAYNTMDSGQQWTFSTPRLEDGRDVVILDPSLKKKTKIGRKVRL